tara:strand:- start:13510 stop:14745 length:1236 start_codon:yes stop_codon:yes gene_type:complete
MNTEIYTKTIECAELINSKISCPDPVQKLTNFIENFQKAIATESITTREKKINSCIGNINNISPTVITGSKQWLATLNDKLDDEKIVDSFLSLLTQRSSDQFEDCLEIFSLYVKNDEKLFARVYSEPGQDFDKIRKLRTDIVEIQNQLLEFANKRPDESIRFKISQHIPSIMQLNDQLGSAQSIPDLSDSFKEYSKELSALQREITEALAQKTGYTGIFQALGQAFKDLAPQWQTTTDRIFVFFDDWGPNCLDIQYTPATGNQLVTMGQKFQEYQMTTLQDQLDEACLKLATKEGEVAALKAENMYTTARLERAEKQFEESHKKNVEFAETLNNTAALLALINKQKDEQAETIKAQNKENKEQAELIEAQKELLDSYNNMDEEQVAEDLTESENINPNSSTFFSSPKSSKV